MKCQLRTSLLIRLLLSRLSAALVFIVVAPTAFAADPVPVSTSVALTPGMNAGEIVARLNRNNELRATALRAYESKRHYKLTYHGFPSNREAGIEVVAHFQAPHSKSFEVVSVSGSKVLQSKVFSKLLESEQEAAHAENQSQTALTPANYRFTLL